MQWVDRGPEPGGLADLRAEHTGPWVEHYEDGIGDRPSDTHWREFHPDLDRVFFGLCAYCEEPCRGEVEHFRPTSRFPNQVYEWSNWLFACHSCNMLKSNKWRGGGYVNPCAKTAPARPESYFDFDIETGELVPLAGLGEARRKKAQQMIADLRLNEHHHLRKRRDWIQLADVGVNNDATGPDIDLLELLENRNSQHSSFVRAWADSLGI